MPISEQNLKLTHSEEDSDFDTAGGQATVDEIVDGALHNLYDATAELDEVQGRIKLRKGYAVVDTATTDRLQQAHLVLTGIPSNELLAATLFSDRDHFSKRPSYVAHLESYFVPGGRFRGYLYGTQTNGARAIEIWQDLTAPLPEVNNTYVLIEDEEQATEIRQYVLITDVSARVETFVDGDGREYQKRICTLTLAARLQAAFHGPEVSKAAPSKSSYKAGIYNVMVASAAEYHSARPTTASAEAGEMAIKVDSIFQQLVPAATIPTPHADLDPTSRDITLVPAADGTVTTIITAAFGAGVVLYLGGPFIPGTLSISASGATLTDTTGTLYSGSTAIGTADPAAGTITGGANCPTYNGSKTATWQPAGAISTPMQTAAIEVKANTQSTAYVLTLPTQPQPGSTRVAYVAQGRWYEMWDRGNGEISGADPAYGAASIRFLTRTLTLSLGALPDVDSWILISWGESVYTFSRGVATLAKAGFEFETTISLAPNSVTVTWTGPDGSPKSAADNGGGALTGDATGEVYYASKKVVIRPNVLPAPGTEFDISSGSRALATQTVPTTPRIAGRFAATLAHTPAIPGTVEVTLPMRFISAWGTPVDKTLTALDDGNGTLLGVSYGTVNYATGAVEINPTLQV